MAAFATGQQRLYATGGYSSQLPTGTSFSSALPTAYTGFPEQRLPAIFPGQAAGQYGCVYVSWGADRRCAALG